MNKYLILLLLVVGCSYLGQPTTTHTTTPTPIDQLWQVAKQTNWLATISILGIAGGVFALMNGNKIGIPAAIASCVSLFMTLAVARFAAWMAVCGLIGSVAICAASILLKKKALVEIITGVQKYKDTCIEVSDNFKQHLNKQSKSTQRLVQQVKGNLKVKGVI